MKEKIQVIISENAYITKLKNLDSGLKDAYFQVKNKFLSYVEVDNYLIEDSETFKVNKKVLGLLTVKDGKLAFYLKLSKNELDKRFNNLPTELNKYKNVPMLFVLDEEVEVRKAIMSIERLAKEYELLEKKDYHPIGFGWLIRF